MEQASGSKNAGQRQRKNPTRALALACLTALIGWAGIYGWWHSERLHASNLVSGALGHQAQQVISKLLDRMRAYEQVLWAVAGTIEGAPLISSSHWRAYVEKLDLHSRYPGILNLGYSRVVRPSDLDKHVLEMRTEGFPNYEIRPPGTRALYSAAVFVNPFNKHNARAIGYDMLSEPHRRAVVEEAARAGNVVLSGPLKLITYSSESKTGQLLVVPVYDRNLPKSSPDQRWQALRGWTYVAYFADELLSHLAHGQSSGLRFRFEDIAGGTNVLMHDILLTAGNPKATPQELAISRQVVKVAERTWRVTAIAYPEFAASVVMPTSLIGYVLGAAASVLFAWLVFSLVSTRDRAIDLARAMTTRLELSQRQIELQNHELRRLATEDPLTACLNRRALFQLAEPVLEQAIRRDQPLSCIMADIDHFKTHNDRHGHPVGDQIIVMVAKTIAKCLRESDLLCRYGGEEFLILLPKTDLASAVQIAERLRSSVEASVSSTALESCGQSVTCSLGVAVSTQSGPRLLELIDLADQAMYVAKRTGRNRVCTGADADVAMPPDDPSARTATAPEQTTDSCLAPQPFEPTWSIHPTR